MTKWQKIKNIKYLTVRFERKYRAKKILHKDVISDFFFDGLAFTSEKVLLKKVIKKIIISSFGNISWIIESSSLWRSEKDSILPGFCLKKGGNFITGKFLNYPESFLYCLYSSSHKPSFPNTKVFPDFTHEVQMVSKEATKSLFRGVNF